MNNKFTSLAALFLALAACLLAAVLIVRGPRREEVRAEATALDANQLESLRKQIADLREEVARLAQPPLQTPLERPAREPAAATDDGKLGARIAALEAMVVALEKDVRVARDARPVVAKPPTDKIAEAQRVATNYAAGEQERVDALAALRGKTFEDKNAITDDVVVAMVALAEQSRDENVRADVYKHLHNTKSDAVRDSMLRALAGDPSAKVRLRAAQDIDTYLADPAVKAALRRAADGDVDAGVRARAEKTLAGDR
jgi:hypothetical protein